MSAGRDNNARLAWTMVAIVGGMLGMAYAAVPLYQAFCKSKDLALARLRFPRAIPCLATIRGLTASSETARRSKRSCATSLTNP